MSPQIVVLEQKSSCKEILLFEPRVLQRDFERMYVNDFVIETRNIVLTIVLGSFSLRICDY